MNYPLCQHPNLFIWDFWYFYDREKRIFHVFFLNADHKYKLSNQHHFHSKVGYATTFDFTELKWINDSVLTSSSNNWDNTSIWSGDVIKTPSGYWMFYTSRSKEIGSGMTQKIGRAFSTDLENWNKDNYFLLEAEKKYYDTEPRDGELTTHAWRDPFIFSFNGEYHMLLSAKDLQSSNNKSGCIAILKSEDLFNWHSLPPLYSPGFFSECEVSQILQNKDNENVILFSNWKKHDFSYLSPKKGGLYSYNLNTKKLQNLIPESSDLYACRVIPELNGDIVGFNYKTGGLQRFPTNFNLKSLKPTLFNSY